jgi:glycine cleavage system H protein
MTPEELKYTKKHEWIRIDGKKAVMGITDHAQGLLGDITFVELPKAGKTVKQSEVLCVVESVKATSEVFSPLGGRVSEANTSLETSPDLVNKEPYGAGWLCKLEDLDLSGSSNLLSAKDYEKFIAEES